MKCDICAKFDVCKKNKTSAKNCKLFIADEQKEYEYYKRQEEIKKEFNKRMAELDRTLDPFIRTYINLLR